MTIKRLNNLITHFEEDNVLNHFKTCFFFGWTEFRGTVSDNEFRIWRFSNWIGLGYPVIIGKVTKVNGKEKITITTKLNAVGQLFVLGMFACFIFIIYSMINDNYKPSDYVVVPLLMSIFLFIYFLYRHTRKEIVNEVITYLKTGSENSASIDN